MNNPKRPPLSDGRSDLHVWSVFRDFADVTWRMVVPIAPFGIVGYVLDDVFDVAPILFITGLGIGFVVGLLLAIRLIHKIQRGESR